MSHVISGVSPAMKRIRTGVSVSLLLLSVASFWGMAWETFCLLSGTGAWLQPLRFLGALYCFLYVLVCMVNAWYSPRPVTDKEWKDHRKAIAEWQARRDRKRHK